MANIDVIGPYGPTVGFFGGLPCSGKSELARRISQRLGWRHIDIDENIRLPIFGKPTPNDGTDPAINARDIKEMSGSYDILFATIDTFLTKEMSLLVTATLSSKKWGQDRLVALMEKHPKANLRVIWCKPQLTDEELAARLKERCAKGYVGATTDPARVRELEKRFEPIVIPNTLVLDTSHSSEIEKCTQMAFCHIL